VASLVDEEIFIPVDMDRNVPCETLTDPGCMENVEYISKWFCGGCGRQRQLLCLDHAKRIEALIHTDRIWRHRVCDTTGKFRITHTIIKI
jgi:hypothetical protein